MSQKNIVGAHRPSALVLLGIFFAPSQRIRTSQGQWKDYILRLATGQVTIRPWKGLRSIIRGLRCHRGAEGLLVRSPLRLRQHDDG